MFQTLIGAVTDKLIPDRKLWQARGPWTANHPDLFAGRDAIHYKVRKHGRYAAKAVYTVLGLNLEGRKEIPSCLKYLSPEGANRFWLVARLRTLNSIKRPARHPVMACVDGLTGCQRLDFRDQFISDGADRAL